MTFKERFVYDPKADLLGRGGFAVVYKATDQLLHRQVALKFFKSDVTKSKYSLVEEIRRVISLEHPNLARYYDIEFMTNTNLHGEEEITEVGVMEYIDGGTVKAYLEKHPEHLDKLLRDIIDGVSFLHRNGIIHRDLKPQNILVKNTPDGPVVKITDFGISKATDHEHTSSSLLIGSIEYMAPEQFNPLRYGIGGKISTNLDIWSFGLLLYELVKKETLFGSRGGGTSAEQVMNSILNQDYLSNIETVPQPYRNVIYKCMVKDAKERIRNIQELKPLLDGPQEAERTPVIATEVIPTVSYGAGKGYKQQVETEIVDLPRKNTANTPLQTDSAQPGESNYPGAVESKKQMSGGTLMVITIAVVLAIVISLIVIGNNKRESRSEYSDYDTAAIKTDNTGVYDPSAVAAADSTSPYLRDVPDTIKK